MATLTVTMAGSALPNTNGSRAFTISDGDLTKLVAWARVVYPVIPSGPDTRTNAQVLLAWFNSWTAATRDSVKRANQDTAATEAIAAVPSIDIT